jgi:hypothetical protein
VLVVISVVVAVIVMAAVALFGVRSARRRRRVSASEPIRLPGVKFHL